jgi:hypothetical protein
MKIITFVRDCELQDRTGGFAMIVPSFENWGWEWSDATPIENTSG